MRLEPIFFILLKKNTNQYFLLQIYDIQVWLVDNEQNYETLKLKHRLAESQFNFIKEPILTRECALETMLQNVLSSRCNKLGIAEFNSQSVMNH